jgi:hypothetical protein
MLPPAASVKPTRIVVPEPLSSAVAATRNDRQRFRFLTTVALPAGVIVAASTVKVKVGVSAWVASVAVNVLRRTARRACATVQPLAECAGATASSAAIPAARAVLTASLYA